MILLPRIYLPHDDQYYNPHRDRYFYLNLYLTQWELQTLSHTNSHSSRRVKIGRTKSWKHFRFCLLSAHFTESHQNYLERTVRNLFVLVEHLVSKVKSFRITARGFVHAISQTLAVLSVLSSHCPSLHQKQSIF